MRRFIHREFGWLRPQSLMSCFRLFVLGALSAVVLGGCRFTQVINYGEDGMVTRIDEVRVPILAYDGSDLCDAGSLKTLTNKLEILEKGSRGWNVFCRIQAGPVSTEHYLDWLDESPLIDVDRVEGGWRVKYDGIAFANALMEPRNYCGDDMECVSDVLNFRQQPFPWEVAKTTEMRSIIRGSVEGEGTQEWNSRSMVDYIEKPYEYKVIKRWRSWPWDFLAGLWDFFADLIMP